MSTMFFFCLLKSKASKAYILLLFLCQVSISYRYELIKLNLLQEQARNQLMQHQMHYLKQGYHLVQHRHHFVVVLHHKVVDIADVDMCENCILVGVNVGYHLNYGLLFQYEHQLVIHNHLLHSLSHLHCMPGTADHFYLEKNKKINYNGC